MKIQWLDGMRFKALEFEEQAWVRQLMRAGRVTLVGGVVKVTEAQS